MIIISDIHGRTFWKTALIEAGVYNIEKNELTESVLFMGDYLDSYAHEYDYNTESYIDMDSEFKNFLDIIEFKKAFPKKVTLLLGNHDCEYIFPRCSECRINYEHKDEIIKIFKENIRLFNFGLSVVTGTKLVTFTHANICPTWINIINPILEGLGFTGFEPTNDNGQNICGSIINVLNGLLSDCDINEKNYMTIGNLIHHIGYGRWGESEVGSLIWADLLDYTNDLDKYSWNDVYQVVAHTQHIVTHGRFTYNSSMFCTDCHIDSIGRRVLFRFIENENEWKPLGISSINTCLTTV